MMRGRMNPREANRMMQRMGMQVKQLDDVTRVILETPSKKIIIDDPEVATVTVQGQVVYQVGGGTVREEAASGATSEDDVKLVSTQAGVSADEARKALQQSSGDLAQAIIILKQKKP
ncbi:MAG TPA: nascent polypeptide-associated complex protein [Candidatus Bathyarchaeia archaeon]|nr:nascent polypeptide-associated complex protein [Candidatus Bathyarchaeia archaeon]